MAKAKAKGITISNWEKMIVDKDEKYIIENDGGKFEITISPTISWDQASEMVDYVTRIVFNDDTGDYHPEVKDALFRAQVLEKYAHFNIPKSFDKIYHLVYSTDVYEHVLQLVNTNQLETLKEAIDDTLDYRLGILAGGVQAEIQKVSESFKTFNDNASEMFSNLDGVDIGSFMKSIADMSENLDEEKLVSAIRKAQGE